MSLAHVVVAENTKIAMEDHKKNSVQTTFDAYFKHFPDKVNEDTTSKISLPYGFPDVSPLAR